MSLTWMTGHGMAHLMAYSKDHETAWNVGFRVTETC